jgi:hypothetical protein
MRALALSLLAASIVVAVLAAEEAPSAQNSGLNLTAKTANVAGAPDDVRIEIVRWSTDDERERLMTAWNLKPGAASGGRGAGKAGKGAGKAGGAGRAGKGGFKGGAPAVEAPSTPEAELAKALQQTTTVGYLWSSETAGYALRYAGKLSNGDGSQRVVLMTHRRLGATNQLWNPTVSGAPNSYEFSVIELRLNAKGEGEGKASLLGKVLPDDAAKIVTLENYDSLPSVFSDVRIKAGRQ